jgi:GGDEF domain-containing protein
VLTERIQQALTTSIDVTGGSWRPSASLGAARAEPDETLTSMLRRADRAMYSAKRTRAAALATAPAGPASP